MIRFACPACNAIMEASPRKAGRKIDCLRCGQRLMIPDPPRGTVLAAYVPPPAPPPPVVAPRRREEYDDEYDDEYEPDERPRRRRGGRGEVRQEVNVHLDGGRAAFPHALHLILTLFTCGAWLPVWLIHYLVWSCS